MTKHIQLLKYQVWMKWLPSSSCENSSQISREYRPPGLLPNRRRIRIQQTVTLLFLLAVTHTRTTLCKGQQHMSRSRMTLGLETSYIRNTVGFQMSGLKETMGRCGCHLQLPKDDPPRGPGSRYILPVAWEDPTHCWAETRLAASSNHTLGKWSLFLHGAGSPVANRHARSCLNKIFLSVPSASRSNSRPSAGS